MLQIIGSGLVGLLMQILGQPTANINKIQAVSWQEAKIFAVRLEPDTAVEGILKQYLKDLSAKGAKVNQQGIWIQSDWSEIAAYQGTVPISAASLTKIATTLAALTKWGANHQFETPIYGTGPIEDGVLQGDLVVVGSGDPLFVWEEAIALGNALNRLGIRQVRGNLVIVGNFSMNYISNPAVAGQLLRQSLDARLWTKEVTNQYQTMPVGTDRPQVAIAPNLSIQTSLPDGSRLLLRHQSMTLAQILKQMNIYSNNPLAEMLAESVGGGKFVAELAAQEASVPQTEIHLINGSGLGVENQISPRAVCKMLMAIERQLKSASMSVTDLFPMSGRDLHGTLKHRHIPLGVAVKTGTLAQVSALAGVFPTSERGLIWFAIINHGYTPEMFRQQQDQLLQRLSQHWEFIPAWATFTASNTYLGDSSRNIQGDF